MMRLQVYLVHVVKSKGERFSRTNSSQEMGPGICQKHIAEKNGEIEVGEQLTFVD